MGGVSWGRRVWNSLIGRFSRLLKRPMRSRDVQSAAVDNELNSSSSVVGEENLLSRQKEVSISSAPVLTSTPFQHGTLPPLVSPGALSQDTPTSSSALTTGTTSHPTVSSAFTEVQRSSQQVTGHYEQKKQKVTTSSHAIRSTSHMTRTKSHMTRTPSHNPCHVTYAASRDHAPLFTSINHTPLISSVDHMMHLSASHAPRSFTDHTHHFRRPLPHFPAKGQ